MKKKFLTIKTFFCFKHFAFKKKIFMLIEMKFFSKKAILIGKFKNEINIKKRISMFISFFVFRLLTIFSLCFHSFLSFLNTFVLCYSIWKKREQNLFLVDLFYLCFYFSLNRFREKSHSTLLPNQFEEKGSFKKKNALVENVKQSHKRIFFRVLFNLFKYF